MMFRYLSAEDICKFFDKFEDEVIERSGLDADELSQLSRTEMNELLNDIFDDVIITKDNIHLYYEFMSDEDLEKYVDILSYIFTARNGEILDILNINRYAVHPFISANWIKNEKGFMSCDSVSVFGVKDTLKPIDQYVEDIKASDEYKNYMKGK